MVTQDRIRLRGLLRKSPVFAGLFYYWRTSVHHPCITTSETSTAERRYRKVAWRAYELQRQLPGLTGGEGVLESSFAGYQPASGTAPTRLRTTANPLNLGEYMMHLARRA